ncbi:MAG: ubiquinol-cytochrome c reductase iron-sulfur subunit N-terminal domain-containing protein [Blastocatellia bacterium]
MSKQRKENKKPDTKQQVARRSFIMMGTGALAAIGVGAAGYQLGWFGGGASYDAALTAANEMLETRAREIGNASVLIHAIRGFGKGFKLADGSSAVEHLCSRYAADKEVGGKRYVYFKRDAEVHENSFLKTFLEAGVSLNQPVTVGATRYTLSDVAESGKALFRCDPQDLFKFDADEFRYDPNIKEAQGQPQSGGKGELVHEHLPWGLIAFSILMRPEAANWANAYGEPISLATIADRSLAEYETTCALGERELKADRTAPPNFREAIKKYSCFGLHSVYGFLSLVQHGYTNNGLAERVNRMMDLVTYRLKGDAEAISEEYDKAAAGAPAEQVEAFRLRALVKHYGHAFEAINYAKLHKLTTFNADQQRRISEGEAAFYESLVKLHVLDWAMMKTKLGEKFVSDIVIAVGHAVRALKLMTPQNPDTAA